MKKGSSFARARAAIWILYGAVAVVTLLLLAIECASASSWLVWLLVCALFSIFGVGTFIFIKYLRCRHCGRVIRTLEPLMHRGCKCFYCKEELD